MLTRIDDDVLRPIIFGVNRETGDTLCYADWGIAYTIAQAQLEADEEKVNELIHSVDLIFKLPRITIENARGLWQALKERVE